MTVQTAFDPVAFKETTRRQWQEAAEAWHRWGGFIGEWLGEATETMIEMAGIGPGSRVLDVAAGAGEQSLRIARRVGPSGRVLATDIAPDLLARAAADAAAEGLGQVETAELDGEAIDTLERSRSTPSSAASASSTSRTSSGPCEGCGPRCARAAGYR